MHGALDVLPMCVLPAQVDLLTELVDLLERSECMPADR